MHEIVNGFTDKAAAVQVGAEQRVTIDTDATTGGDAIQCPGIVESLKRLAGGIKQVAVWAGRDGNARAGCDNVGVTAEVMVRDGIVPGRYAIIAPKPVAPIVAAAALLSETGFWLEGPGV